MLPFNPIVKTPWQIIPDEEIHPERKIAFFERFS